MNNTASALAIRDPLEQSSKSSARRQGLYIAGHEATLGSYRPPVGNGSNNSSRTQKFIVAKLLQ